MIEAFLLLLETLLVLCGGILAVLAAVGIVRLPDVPTRMHASTKSGALGVMSIMTAAALYFGSGYVAAKVTAIIAFIVLTAPVAAHAIGRASYLMGVPLWDGTVKDELAQAYDLNSGALASPPQALSPDAKDAAQSSLALPPTDRLN